MSRRVFFSFYYADDITRAMIIRNNGAFRSVEEAGFSDKAEFETVQRQGDQAIKNWINRQLDGTSVTAVLIGQNTLNRPWVQHEIKESYNRGNAIIGVKIHNVKSLQTPSTTVSGNISTKVTRIDGIDRGFDEIAHSIHDYVLDNGYNNLGTWVEAAARAKGK